MIKLLQYGLLTATLAKTVARKNIYELRITYIYIDEKRAGD